MLDKFDITDLLGKEYELDGRGPDRFDCWGLCVEVGKRAGINFIDGERPEDNALKLQAFEKGKEDCFVQIEKPKPFCIVLFRMPPPIIWHTGIVLPDNKTFVHILEQCTVCVERFSGPDWDSRWSRRFKGFYEYRKQ